MSHEGCIQHGAVCILKDKGSFYRFVSSGHTVVFADQSGMNASGHVMLGTMDVHHQWTKVLQLLSL